MSLTTRGKIRKLEIKMKLKITVFVVLMIAMWGIRQTFLTGIEPVIASDVSINQMSDTTSGHVMSRAYLNDFQKIIYSPILPVCISLLIFAMLFTSDIKQVIIKKKAPENEENT